VFSDLLKFRNTTASGSPREKPPLFTQADFLPYACHISPHTLLTKNGELLQIIRIAADAKGHAYESESAGPHLRERLSAAICAQAASESLALWIHTLRRRAPLPPAPQFKNKAAAAIAQDWNTSQAWTHTFRNEVYVTLLHRGQLSKLLNAEEFKHGFLRGRHRRYREAYIDQAEQQLDQVMEAVCAELAPHFAAERLRMTTRDGGHFSEPLEFLHYLLNLTEAPMPASSMDAGRQLSTHDITFGFDTLESKAENSRRFAAILSLKGCPELPVAALDRCLQLPEECIITQTIHFLPHNKATQKQDEIRDVLETSPDDTILEASGLAAMLLGEEGGARFVEQHTSILVMRERYALLDEAVGRMQQAFGTLGLITVREDIMLEENFWAQLPGNFEFIRRTSIITARRMAGMARLNHFPCGEEQSPWGGAVTLFPTTLETPYAFHFHVGKNGHSALLDFNNFTDARGATLTNFLLSFTQQYNGRFIVLDRDFSARPLVQAFGGEYLFPAQTRKSALKTINLNPFQLEDTPRNRAFLTAWLSHFIEGSPLHAGELRGALEDAVETLFSLPPEDRQVHTALHVLLRNAPALGKTILPPDPELFASGPDTLDLSANALGIELSSIVGKQAMALPIFSYLLHRIISALDGKPTIIVVHEAWDFLDNAFFAARISSLLDMLTQHNAMLLLTSRHFAQHEGSDFTAELMPRLATTLILPDDLPTDYFAASIGLTPSQERLLTSLDRQKGEFFVRHGTETLACVLPASGISAHADLLAGDSTALRLAQIRQSQG